MKIVIDKQAKPNECDKTGCRNKAVKYVRLSGYGVNLCRKHAQQLYALDAAFLPPAERVQISDIIPAGEVDSQPSQ